MSGANCGAFIGRDERRPEIPASGQLFDVRLVLRTRRRTLVADQVFLSNEGHVNLSVLAAHCVRLSLAKSNPVDVVEEIDAEGTKKTSMSLVNRTYP
jgi:hypothetical protein